MAIYQIKVDDGYGASRTFSLDGTASLKDLHDAVQKAFGLSSDSYIFTQVDEDGAPNGLTSRESPMEAVMRLHKRPCDYSVTSYFTKRNPLVAYANDLDRRYLYECRLQAVTDGNLKEVRLDGQEGESHPFASVRHPRQWKTKVLEAEAAKLDKEEQDLLPVLKKLMDGCAYLYGSIPLRQVYRIAQALLGPIGKASFARICGLLRRDHSAFFYLVSQHDLFYDGIEPEDPLSLTLVESFILDDTDGPFSPIDVLLSIQEEQKHHTWYVPDKDTLLAMGEDGYYQDFPAALALRSFLAATIGEDDAEYAMNEYESLLRSGEYDEEDTVQDLYEEFPALKQRNKTRLPALVQDWSYGLRRQDLCGRSYAEEDEIP